MTAHKTPLSIALFALLGTGALTAQASHLLLQNGDRLTVDAGVAVTDQFGSPVDVSSGSFFLFDTFGDGKIRGPEKVPIAMGTTGFIVGLTSLPGEIDALWQFPGGGQGQDYITIPFSPLAAGMDMSGWTMSFERHRLRDGYWRLGTQHPLQLQSAHGLWHDLCRWYWQPDVEWHIRRHLHPRLHCYGTR
ncbi:MAG: hypothetical protein R3F42_02295 [Pseudomonadota bacterium]